LKNNRITSFHDNFVNLGKSELQHDCNIMVSLLVARCFLCSVALASLETVVKEYATAPHGLLQAAAVEREFARDTT